MQRLIRFQNGLPCGGKFHAVGGLTRGASLRSHAEIWVLLQRLSQKSKILVDADVSRLILERIRRFERTHVRCYPLLRQPRRQYPATVEQTACRADLSRRSCAKGEAAKRRRTGLPISQPERATRCAGVPGPPSATSAAPPALPITTLPLPRHPRFRYAVPRKTEHSHSLRELLHPTDPKP